MARGLYFTNCLVKLNDLVGSVFCAIVGAKVVEFFTRAKKTFIFCRFEYDRYALPAVIDCEPGWYFCTSYRKPSTIKESTF